MTDETPQHKLEYCVLHAPYMTLIRRGFATKHDAEEFVHKQRRERDWIVGDAGSYDRNYSPEARLRRRMEIAGFRLVKGDGK